MSFAILGLFWHRGSLGLPQVVMNRQRVYADGHGFGRDQVKLLPVRTVFVQLVNHFLGDALWARSGQLVDFFGVGMVAVKCSELAAGVAE